MKSGVYEFDEDTRVEETEPGVFRARVSERWSIGAVPNGGYVMSIGMRALSLALGAPDPLSVTGHFLRPATPDELWIETEVIKQGRRYATGSARLVQREREILRLVGTYGDLSRHEGPTRVTGSPPAVPALGDEALARSGDGLPAIAERFDFRFAKETMRWLDGERAGGAEIRGAVRFRDRRLPDTLALGVLADAFPPPVFAIISPSWLPTLELTVHARARPKSEWLHAVFRTRFLFGGFLEEDGEIWDETGQLVALSRQLAMVRG
ncbi:MAG TPA: thioesterase family protein [Polyangiaceae bacterium]